jgi:hypothetical protein
MSHRVKGVLLIVLGFVVGFALTLAVPAMAHFTRSTSYRHDWGHVKALETRIATLEARTATLEAKTKIINQFFTGSQDYYIYGDKIWAPPGCASRPAEWSGIFGNELGC